MSSSLDELEIVTAAVAKPSGNLPIKFERRN